jgi:hypothetical protein
MQAPFWVVRLVSWRWMPSVALVVGSLAFVGIAVLVVPDDLGNVASGTERLSRATRDRASTSVQPVSEEEGLRRSEDGPSTPLPAHRLVPQTAKGSMVESIFHPIPRTELPVEPVDPEPQPPPPPPPPPPPTATIYTLENPPPPPSNFVPPPPDPPEPQGITGR